MQTGFEILALRCTRSKPVSKKKVGTKKLAHFEAFQNVTCEKFALSYNKKNSGNLFLLSIHKCA
jgi:hypothetical protein